MATNICHWLKVQSRWFKNYIFVKKFILISFWIFKYCFYNSFTHYYCAIFYSLDAGLFQYHPGGKQFGSRSGPTKCLGPNSLQGLSAANKMSGWIWVQTVCKGYQQTTKVGKELNAKKLVDMTFLLKPWLKLISFGYNFFRLAKVLATTNSEPDLALTTAADNKF